MEQVSNNELTQEYKSPINWELMEQRSLDAESLKKVLPVFVENNTEHVLQLQQAWDNQDKETIRSLAHTIKGSSANIGAEELSQAALTLEQAYHTDSWGNGQELVQRIKELHEELQGYVSGLA